MARTKNAARKQALEFPKYIMRRGIQRARWWTLKAHMPGFEILDNPGC